MKKNSRWYGIVLAMFVFLLGADAFALELSRCFSDGMVLQREKPVKIWGTAGKHESVAVTFAGKSQKATADKDGKWAVTLAPMQANATPQALKVQAGTAVVTLRDIVIGDVFLFARQSCIDVTLGAKPDGKKLADRLSPGKTLRFVRIVTSPAKTPRDNWSKDATKGWTVLDKQSAQGMSTAAFLLVCELANRVDVPVGIVDLDMGYYFASAWLSAKGAELALNRKADSNDLKSFIDTLPKQIDEWEKNEGGKPQIGLAPMEMPTAPFVCYNAMIHPMRGIGLKGMLLQLGNDYTMVAYKVLRKKGLFTDRAELDNAYKQSYLIYKMGVRMSPQMVPVIPGDLRQSLGEDETLPIGWIVPPGSTFYDYAIHNREIRELQRRAQLETKNLDLIMPGTEHVPLSGQPADEALLARRCTQWVIGTFYDKKTKVSGPIFDRLEYDPEKAEATIFFKPGTAEGLTARGDVLDRFEAGSADSQFVPCKARIEGNTIKLDGEGLPDIIFVRYNWSKKPAQGLVNNAGLPAVPFNTDSSWKFDWWPGGAPVELPVEYHTIAARWPDRDIAIFSGANILSGGDSQSNPNDLGPTGIVAAPFGPNLYVHKITPGSPADGQVLPDDIIYGVNGEDFGAAPDDKYRQFAAGITHSESYAGGGKMTLKIRRKGKLILVPIQLEVLGSYSATTPWYCAKSRHIVANAEKWMIDGMRPTQGLPQLRNPDRPPFNTNALFLLASGNPKCLGLVRRVVYRKMSQMDPNQAITPGGSNWNLGYNGLLFGEYYHRTGDKNVLPYLKYITDMITRHQYRPPGADLTTYAVAKTDEQTGAFYAGWNHKFPGYGRITYGLMAAAGMPCIMDLKLAKDAGVDIDNVSLQRGIRHYNYKRAAYAYVLYSYYKLRIDGPRPIDPDAEESGKTSNMNGKLGTAAALMTIVGDEGDYKDSVEICSRKCVYSFNNTRHGHGGMFFNNFWTPIGAHLSGEKGFKHFMKGQTWWRELYRRHDGSFTQAGRGGIGVAYAIHPVAPQERLRILGAPRSAFSANPPAYLKPALAAHAERDYALAETLIQKELEERVIGGEELRTVKHFLDSIQILKQSVEYDLRYTEALLKQGKYYMARFELPQLKGVVNPNSPRLIAIAEALQTDEAAAAIARVERMQREEQAKARALAKASRKSTDESRWVTVVKDGAAFVGSRRNRTPRFLPDELNQWRMKVLETQHNAPNGWVAPDFDDSAWDKTRLPIQWPVSHAVLLRTTFNVDDKAAYDTIRVVGRFWKHRNVEVYLNGKLVAKANLGAPESMPLTQYAMDVLKQGTNTLAVTTQHHRRWANRGGTQGGLSVRLECRKKER